MRKFSLVALLLVGGYVIAADKADPEAAKKALKQLEGNYTLQSAEKGGEKAPPEALKDLKSISIKGDRFTIHGPGGQDKVATISVDPTQKPAHFNVTPNEGPEKDKKLPGIYKLEKGLLTICVDDGGKARPKDFATSKEDRNILLILKRSKE